MNPIYNSDLHSFVEGYFKTIGAYIVEKYVDFFTVLLPDGKLERFTYTPKVAGENKDVKLLAKGSRYLKEMVQECSSRASLSAVRMNYSSQSVAEALKPKGCCDLCPFVTICENMGCCCDFCYNYKNCNTRIDNAEFSRLGNVVESKPSSLLCFVFMVELSNDYSLSQKIEKNITVLLDLNTGRVLNNVLARDLIHLDIQAPEGSVPVDLANYPVLLKNARQEAENILKEQLDVFKKEIEGPLKDKITAIVDKFEEEYVENYTRTTIDQLDQLQNEALKLCEREIRGYTINSSFHLKNVLVIDTNIDIRELYFKVNQKELAVRGEIFLSRIDIQCSQCGTEIDKAVLCENGHVLCSSCSDTCCTCGKTNCDVCDDETYICATCGETVCSHCSQRCSSCGAVVCSSHAYSCGTCGEVFCIDCHEICNTCGTNACSHHTTYCSECDEAVCPQHTHNCSVCSKPFCHDHVYNCTVCGDTLCENHTNFSAFSSRPVCDSHKATCSICEDVFAQDEVKNCSECSDVLCPTHSRECSKCGKVFCSKHINHCESCGKEICSCTSFTNCRLCGQEFCSDCVDDQGYCRACNSLTYIDKSNKLVAGVIQSLPGLEKYRKYYLGVSAEVKVLYAKGLLNNTLVVLNSRDEVIGSRDINLFEDLKRRFNKK